MKMAFIIGIARSGTSILGELLASHRHVSYVFEAHHVWELGGVGSGESHRLTEEHATPRVKQEIRDWFARQGAQGRVLLEKNPRNTLRVPYVRAIFPDAKFIHIIRDGRDVACSMVPGCGGDDWGHLKPPSWKRFFSENAGAVRCALAWTESMHIALQDLGAAPHLQVRYEDLVREPVEEAHRLCDYLELDMDPAMLDFTRKIQDTTAGSHQAAKQSMWYRENHRVRIGRYRENLTAEELRIIIPLLAPTLERLGYQVESGEGSSATSG